MPDTSPFPAASEAAVFHVDRGSDEICYCNDAASTLLGRSCSAMCGQPWWRALGLRDELQPPLARAFRAGTRTAFAPTLLSPAGGDDIVVGGYLFAQRDAGRDVMVLLLFQLAARQPALPGGAPAPTDTVAVLGLEHVAGGEGSSVNDLSRRMIDIRFGLQQIVPDPADVGMPVGAYIPLVLRNVTPEQSRDIGRALLSHLSPILGEGALLRIGLAAPGGDTSALAALVAANQTLLQLQQGKGETVAEADVDEFPAALHGSAGSEGIFSEDGLSDECRSYLHALAALAQEVPSGSHALLASEYLPAVTALTARQRGVEASAIYRRVQGESYEFAGGALAGQGEAIGEKQLPRALRQLAKKIDAAALQSPAGSNPTRSGAALFALRLHDRVQGFMALQYGDGATALTGGFRPDTASLHYLASVLAALPDFQSGPVSQPVAPRPSQEAIDGYVGDNMEGAIDQAVFLSRLDVPVAIVGPRGTGKLYVAKVIHQETGAAAEKMLVIDCHQFRGRKDATARVASALERSAGKTLVFKSPHLMHAEVQLKLARQLSSRVLADVSPPRYLPAARVIALFPDSMEQLVRHGGLNDRLASVFSAYPIRVPPLKDRKRAVLRWAHKILSQEAARRDRRVTGFTPDAEEAMLQHDWPGNISEMRQCITSALDKSDKEWLTPVDLGIFKGLSPQGGRTLAEKQAFLQLPEDEPVAEVTYAASSLEELEEALAQALHSLLESEVIKPLGAWLDDEVVLAACARYRDNSRAVAEFLQTKPRNIGRWLPKIESRAEQRDASSLWQTPQRLVHQWIREAAPAAQAPQQLAQELMMSHVLQQCGHLSLSERASIMGVSAPTFQKRLQDNTRS